MNITVESIYVYVCIILKKSRDRRIKKHLFSNTCTCKLREILGVRQGMNIEDIF